MKRLVAAGLLTLSGLVACGSTGRQAAEPPPLASLLATPSPTPTPPPVSVIRAAVQAYIAGVNVAFRTGDISQGIKASTPTCKCRDQLSNIAAVYARHDHFAGTHIVIVRIVAANVTGTSADARLTFRVPASAIANAKGQRRPLKASPTKTVTASLEQTGGNWLVSSLEGLPKVSGRSATATPTPHPTPAPSPSA